MKTKIKNILLILLISLSFIISIEHTFANINHGYIITRTNPDPVFDSLFQTINDRNNGNISTQAAIDAFNYGKVSTDDHYWNMIIDPITGVLDIKCNNQAVIALIVPSPQNGTCGLNGGDYSSEELSSQTLCTAGDVTGFSDNTSSFKWDCSGRYGGSTDNCSVTKKIAGVCGPVSGGNFTAAQVASGIGSAVLCTEGTNSPIDVLSDGYQWTCVGVNGGNDANCSVGLKNDGVCGAANGGNYTSAGIASAQLCSAGTVMDFSVGGTSFIWDCSGLNGGGRGLCSADISIGLGGTPPPLAPPTSTTIDNTSVTTVNTGDQCHSFIYAYKDWSDCIKTSTPFDASGDANCIQKLSENPVEYKCGNWTTTTTTSTHIDQPGHNDTSFTSGIINVQDYDLNGIPTPTGSTHYHIVRTCDISNCADNGNGKGVDATIIEETKIINFSNTINTNSCTNIIANYSSSCSIELNAVTGNGIREKIAGLGSPSLQSFRTNETTDRINGAGVNAFHGLNISSNINSLNEINFSGIKSLAPFNGAGVITYTFGGTTYTLNPSLSFIKPFIGKFEASVDGGINWNGTPSVGTNIEYKISQNSASINNFSVTNYDISLTDSNLEFQNKININNGFSARINTTNNTITSLSTPEVKLTNVAVTYKLGGQWIKDYLGTNTTPDTIGTFILGGDSFLGVKIIGKLQGLGKQTITGQENNFSKISISESRRKIKENTYKLIKGINNVATVKKVKYINGNNLLGNYYTISGEDFSYETLIIDNGNLRISGNVNENGNKLGIIVLSDGYDVEKGINQKGNIYIDKNVKYINAMIYSDGGIISSNNGIPYTTDTPNRTADLQEQLVLKGNIFTRNTIGGAILSGGNYILPGDKKIGNSNTDFEKAMIYDLNYIRRGNNNPDPRNGGNNDNPFVIIYNPDIQIDPPKGFRIN